jgi:hypothetical protein
MRKRYVYKNVNKRPVNIGGYRFKEGQELESDVRINGFNEAVGNGFLELTERNPQGVETDATPAPQTGNTGNTGNTGKVKVTFHMGLDAEGKEVLKEVALNPGTPVKFPGIDLGENETFEGWFKDAEFGKPVNLDKAKAPKEGDLHFYGKILKKEDTPPVNPNPNGEDRQVTLPPLPPPPPVDDKSTPTDPETK